MVDQKQNPSKGDPPNNRAENSAPGISSSAPLPSTLAVPSVTNVNREGEDRIRSASISLVSPNTIKSTQTKSTVTSTSSDGGRMRPGGTVHSPAGSLQLSQQLQDLPPTLKRTFSGRHHHRQSGLFSKDDLSVDLSISPSHIIPPLVPVDEGRRQSAVNPAVGSVFIVSQEQSTEEKRHPISIAGSVGSASVGSGSDDRLYTLDPNHPYHPKHRYKPLRRKWRRFRRKYKGCIFALMSSIASSLTSYFVHHLTKRGEGQQSYDVTYCLLWRYFGVLFPGIFIVLYYRFWQKEMVFDTVWPLSKQEPLKRFVLSVIRAIIDVVAVLLNYLAFKYLLQSETSTILNSKPIVVQLLAHFTLGEPWGIVPILMSVLAGLGVLIISKPPFLEGKSTEPKSDFEGRLVGIGYSTGSMLLSAVVYVILRYLKDVHYSVFSLSIGTVGVIFSLGMTLFYNTLVWPLLEDLGYFITVSGLVCCSSIFIVIALQNEEAFIVSLVRSLDVIFSFIWEISLDGRYPDWYSGGGACIVMVCVVVIFFRKYLSHQDPNSKIYKALHFLTK